MILNYATWTSCLIRFPFQILHNKKREREQYGIRNVHQRTQILHCNMKKGTIRSLKVLPFLLYFNHKFLWKYDFPLFIFLPRNNNRKILWSRRTMTSCADAESATLRSYWCIKSKMDSI